MFCTVLLWVSTRKAANAATLSAKAAKESAEATTVAADAGKKSADAAVEAAEASKKSTDLLAELNRPYMGVSYVELRPDANAQNRDSWDIAWAIENFGALPALSVNATIELLLDQQPLSSEIGPISAEVFPKSKPIETTTVLQWGVSNPGKDAVLRGEKFLIVKISVDYRASSGTRYSHEAHAQFLGGRGKFSVLKSTTRTVK